jgi:hypothetical protein
MNKLPPDFDPIALAGIKAKGKRPWFFGDPDVERVLSIAMSIAMEHAVTRQRLDALERTLEAKGLMTRSELEAFAPSVEAEAERTLWMKAYIARVLRILQQEAEAAKPTRSAHEQPVAEIMEELRHS